MEALFICYAYQSQTHLFTSCPHSLAWVVVDVVVVVTIPWPRVSHGVETQKNMWNRRWSRTEDMMSIYSHEYRFSPAWETHAFIQPFWSWSYFSINHISGCFPLWASPRAVQRTAKYRLCTIYADTFKCCVKCSWIKNLIGRCMHHTVMIWLYRTDIV